MTARVVDASALVDALLETPRQDAVLDALRGHDLFAPGILDLEVASALHRLERAGRISARTADGALADLESAPIRRVPADRLVADAWRHRHAVRLSDAFYVATASLLDAELLTTDGRLARSPRPGVPIVLVG